MRKKLIVVVGAGPGIGNNVAKKFGSNNFRVVLISRNQEALNGYVNELQSEGIETFAVSADAGNPETLTKAFEKIKKEHGTTDVLVYNSAIKKTGLPTTLSAESLVSHYQVDVVGALHSVQQVLPAQLEQNEGTIIFTNGGLALSPSADYTALSMGKAALRSLAHSLAEQLSSKGIFVGSVIVTGFVKPDTYYAPSLIAEKYWELYEKRDENEIEY